MDTKTCSKCGKELPLSSFGVKNKARNTLQARCKECIKEDKRISYYKHFNANREQIRHRKDQYKQINKELKNQMKQSGCVLCGEKDIACLDFHHVKEKNFTIAAKQDCSESTLKEEIDKCIVLCANCHRKLHYYSKYSGPLVEAL